MIIIMSCFFFILGLRLGAFYYIVGMRIPANESIFTPDSHYPSCKPHLLVGEVMTGLLFLWVFLRFGITIEGLIGLILVSLTIIISISDFKYMLIPNNILLFFLPIILILRLLFPLHSIGSHLLGAAVGGGLILLIVIVSRGGMGAGDAKLFFLCGLVLGFHYTLLGLFIACLLGSLVGGTLLLLKIVKRKQPIPFGPFLALGTLITYGYGTDIIHNYISILGNLYILSQVIAG
jgi:leader peptidase (prepilin peptidase) / N-methyltransferase